MSRDQLSKEGGSEQDMAKKEASLGENEYGP